MRYFIAFVAWCLLLTPALNLGRAWQSSAADGPKVTVHFSDASKTGVYVYELDGSNWLVEETGHKHRIRGTERITSVEPIDTNSGAARGVGFGQYWRGIIPLLALTLLLFAVVTWMRRSESGFKKA